MKHLRLLALLPLLLAGCWVPAERGRLMERRIQRLEDENQLVNKQLEEQREVFRDRVAKADAKIAEVQKKLDELNATARRTGADVGVRQDQMDLEIARLRGLVEEAQQRVVQLDRALAQARQEQDAKFAALRGAGALDEYETRKKLENVKRPADARGYLALAREQEAAGEKGVARTLYDELAKKWPTDPAAAEAHFRLGDAYAADGRHREAILAFGKLAQEFPKSERTPEAMLKTGDSLVALGLRDEGLAVYQELQAKHPATPAAKAAKAKAAELAPAPKKNAAKRR